MSANVDISAGNNSPEKQGVENWRADYATRFKPGVSGNPGGQRKGQVYVSERYKYLLTLSPAELDEFEPATVADEIALNMAQKARENVKTELFHQVTGVVKEITDRTEGKAPQRLQLEPVDPEHVAQQRRDEIKSAMLADPQFAGCDPDEVEKAVERAFERQAARLSG